VNIITDIALPTVEKLKDILIRAPKTENLTKHTFK